MTHLTGDEVLKYLRRWDMALENYSAEHAEPNGPTCFYSTRTAKNLIKNGGLTVALNERHRCVWGALTKRAHDLTQSQTHTWVGVENLAQQAGMSATSFNAALNDLKGLGLVESVKRGKNLSNETRIFLPGVDHSAGPQAVFAAEEDIGHYVCQAALRRMGSSKTADDQENNADLEPILAQLKHTFHDHKNFTKKNHKTHFMKCLRPCADLAGDGNRAHHVIHYVLTNRTQQGLKVIEKIEHANDLAAYIRGSFSDWLENYPGDLPELQ